MQQVQEVTGTEKMQPLKLLAEPFRKVLADTFSWTVENPILWSAEDPQLYD